MVKNSNNKESIDIGLTIRRLIWAFGAVLLCPIIFYLSSFLKPEEVSRPAVVMTQQLERKQIDEASGLIIDDGYEIVRGTCSACHSIDLVIQNSATREGWKDLIVWMQETQKLWDLGDSEDLILDYLEKNYAPKKQGRRAPLKDIDWYDL